MADFNQNGHLAEPTYLLRKLEILLN